MRTCEKCGGAVIGVGDVIMYSGPLCYGHWESSVPSGGMWSVPSCQHCYCIKTDDGHKKCCNCGNRQIDEHAKA